MSGRRSKGSRRDEGEEDEEEDEDEGRGPPPPVLLPLPAPLLCGAISLADGHGGCQLWVWVGGWVGGCCLIIYRRNCLG